MKSREKILSRILEHQPESTALRFSPEIQGNETGSLQIFTEVLTKIGGHVYQPGNLNIMKDQIRGLFPGKSRKITTLSLFSDLADTGWTTQSPSELQDVEVAIIGAHFGVAENGALWITEDQMKQRVVPFICQHLVLLLGKKEILSDMKQAYSRIGDSTYGFGTFISGPSKTADIEQSLVLGAHGPKSLHVFLLD
jgi:L-lactate dehydrogenase complex protein LldG